MMNRIRVLALFSLLHASPLFAQSPQLCDGLRNLALANTVVTTATVVTGSFTPPGATNPVATIGTLPSFCRVAATLKPTPDSEIDHGWNDQLVAPMNSVNY
jgi:feruloyl esterase